MTKKEQLLKELAKLLECDAEKVVPEAQLMVLGPWDSLSVMTTVVAIEEICGKLVPGRLVADCVTVEDVLRVAGME